MLHGHASFQMLRHVLQLLLRSEVVSSFLGILGDDVLCLLEGRIGKLGHLRFFVLPKLGLLLAVQKHSIHAGPGQLLSELASGINLGLTHVG